MKRHSYPTLNALAVADLMASLRSTPFWMSLAWSDILQRYRGSLIGPFWLTISSGVFIFGLGPLYSALFGLDVKKYLPFMSLGLLVWGFLTGVINEACRAMLDNASMMKQVKLPRTLFIFQLVARNFMILLHTLPVFIIVFFYCDLSLSLNMLLIVPGAVLLLANMFWISLLLSIVCARFRDLTQIVSSILQLSFFLTPIIWNPRTQHAPSWIVDLNPLYALIQLLRAPLLGEPLSLKVIAMAGFCLIVGGAFTAWLFSRARKQIVYWI
ncbi:ABC transporter permease [Bosea sp. (in: a-proteobacteria)]|jgi:ABC-type polysaccharide/polyol phosphate export permease|uniref:ABC transporter permease n=1 Tax=Bosea sp. (in: a-proteobacteria) TaxID=1871050 RepID=UPI003566ACE9